MRGIERNYPGWPSTFSACATNNCNGAGRGGGFCASCCEEKLADVAGGILAGSFHEAVKSKNSAVCAIMDSIEAQDNGS